MLTVLLSLSIQAIPALPSPHFETIDVDRDELPDLFVIRPDGESLLLGNDGGGRLVDRTAELGLDQIPDAEASEWRDVDGDGWDDLVVLTREGSLRLYRNENGAALHEQMLFTAEERDPIAAWQWLSLDEDEAVDLLVQTKSAVHVLLCSRNGAFHEASSHAFVTRRGGASSGERSGAVEPVTDDGERGVATATSEARGSLQVEPRSERESEEEGRRQPRPQLRGRATAALTSSSSAVISSQTVDYLAGGAAPVVAGCAMSVRDAATTGCVSASSIPLLGALYPLGTELFIDPDGRVSLGTTSPSPARLTVLADSAPGGTGDGVYIETPVGSATALYAISSSNSDGVGVRAEANSEFGRAFRGVNNSMVGKSIALEGISRSPDAEAIFGYATSTTGNARAVSGRSDALDGIAIYGEAKGFGDAIGVVGETQGIGPSAAGVLGVVDAEVGVAPGVWGIVESDDAPAVRATHIGSTPNSTPIACLGEADAHLGVGVLGVCSGDFGVGTQGQVPNAGTGVYGVSNAAIYLQDPPFATYFASQGTTGVSGIDLSPTEPNVGVFGTVYSDSPEASGVWGLKFLGAGAGVKGQNTSGESDAAGVLGDVGTIPGTRSAGVRGEAGSPGLGGGSGVLGIHNGVGYGVQGQSVEGIGVRAFTYFGTALETFGNADIFGDLEVSGAKNFVHPHPTDPSKEIRFTCLEGNESGTYFRGSAELNGGRATIVVPEDFRLVSDVEGLTVHLTAVGKPAMLWVESQDLTSIVIRGDADARFHYVVNGVREGFAELETIVDNKHYVPIFDDLSFHAALRPAQRARLIESGVLRPDGMPNKQTAARMGWELKESLASTPAVMKPVRSTEFIGPKGKAPAASQGAGRAAPQRVTATNE
jgi:hypothetical protein